MRVLITVLYASSVALIATGVVLVLRKYQWDRVTLGLAMSAAESPGAPPLPLIAIGLFPFAFPADEDRRQLRSFLDRLRVIVAQEEAASEAGRKGPDGGTSGQQQGSGLSDATVATLVDIMPGLDPRDVDIFIKRFGDMMDRTRAADGMPDGVSNPNVFDILRQASDDVNLSDEFATLVRMASLIDTCAAADTSSRFVRQYRSLANEYRAWAGRAPLRTVTRDLYRRRGSERLGAYIAVAGALLDITATMLWLWAL
jgi:hypothetical protein